MQPLVAIHDSEFTRALAAMPASGDTPTGPGTTGYQWWVDNWNYFVMPESVEEALRSDGTQFKVVGDSNIIGGQLLDSNGLPAFPIVISLASEAVSSNEAVNLTNYVAAGGFLFVGSSAFTRDTNGNSLGDFAFANAMGVHMATNDLNNWVADEFFAKTAQNRIVQDIPDGELQWLAPLSSDEINYGISPNHGPNPFHLIWQVQPGDAAVLAAGGTYANPQAYPYLLIKQYGKGYFIYDAAMQPLIGHNAYFPGMYTYMVFREAIQWAFQTAKIPIPKVSPWPYRYNAAVMFRHDMEDFPDLINTIESSAQYEHSKGARGDYYFCTGTLRSEYTPMALSNEIASLQRAISLDGATIGSHNGGLPNPNNPSLLLTNYDYWHWGPDEALDATPAGYSNGTAYAFAAVSNSYADLEGWGLTNGSGLRDWAAPAFNADREPSKQILQQLGVATAGEQKLSPFPHWTTSADSSGLRYSVLSLPLSDWFVGGGIAQSLEDGQTEDTMEGAVNFYYNLGTLINFYCHSPSDGSTPTSEQGVNSNPQLAQEYVNYTMNTNLFPQMWSANADSIYQWWVKRSPVRITPTWARIGNQSVTTISISGSSDTNTAVECLVSSPTYSGVQVYTNGVLSDTNNYRTIGQTIRVLAGTTVTNVQVRYTLAPTALTNAYYVQPGNTLTVTAPGVLANDLPGWGTNLTAQLVAGPTQGAFTLNSNGSFTYTPTNNFVGTDSFIYQANDGQTNSSPATVTITVMPGPLITSGPAGVSTSAGANVSFNVVATNGPLTYQWFLNGTNSLIDGGGLSGSATATLTLNDVLGGDAGQYSVVVSNPAGSVTSAPPAVLTVADPVLTMAPVGMIQNNGTTVELNVGAFGTSPLSYQWFLNGQPIAGANDAVEVLTGVTNGGAGSYSVVISNSFGSITANITNVQSFASGSLFSDNFSRGTDPGPIAPWIAAVGAWTVTGQTLDVTGLSSGVANAYVPGTNWGDYSVQANIEFPAGSYGGGLGGHLDPNTGAHYGAWVYPEGSPGGSSVLKLVKFSTWSGWSGNPMAQVALTNGVGTNWHLLNMTFRANEILVYYDGSQVADVVDDGFDGVSPYLSGGISVDTWAPSPAQAMIVSNVLVSEFPPAITNQPQASATSPGGNVTFTVGATGTSPIFYQWLANGMPLTDGGNVYGSATAGLTISNVSVFNAAVYSVIVSNAFGNVLSSNATLTVSGPPVIIGQPTNLTVAAGTTASFTVQAAGSALTFQWYANSNLLTGATNSLLSLNNVSDANEGVYNVIVSNSYGAVLSSNATLTVDDCFSPPSGLIGWWPGEGNANDIAGTNNGTLEEGVVANAPGVVGSAFHFDGTTGFIQISNAPELNPSNVTIECWVKFDTLDTPPGGSSYPGQQYLVFKQNSRVSNFEGFELSKDRYPPYVGTNDTFNWEVTSASGELTFLESQTVIQTNVWYYVAGVRGSNYLQLYVNGNLEAETSVDFPQDYGNEPLYFGSTGQSYYDHKLGGSLDEVSMYDRALSSNEIAAIYQAGIAGKCRGRTLVVTVGNQSRAYGATNPVFTVSYSGFVGSDGTNVLSGTPIIATAAGTNSPVGTYPITISQGTLNASNYSLMLVGGTLTVTQATVTIASGVLANDKVYDGTMAATLTTNNVVLSGVLIGDTANVALTTNGYVANFASANAGTGIGVTVSGLALAGSASGNYILSQPTNLAANITGRGVTISSGITANNKIYDGTTQAGISSNNVVLNGVLAGDAPNVALSTNSYTANFAGPNAGTGIGVTVTGLTLTGGASSNYLLSQPTNLAANITGRGVTISSGVTANNKVYDGTMAATLTTNNVVLSGVLIGDTSNVALTTNGYVANFVSPNVGTGIGVTVSGLTLTGGASGNYLLSQPTNLAANITGKGVTVSSGLTANNKIYDGTTQAGISSNNVVLNGVLAGDTANVTLSTNGYIANFASANVGTGIGVTVGGLTLTGSASGNYLLSQPTNLAANITGKGVTISSGIAANNKVYDGTTQAGISSNSVVLNGVLAGDTANVALSTNGYIANFGSANVGTGIGVTVSGLTLTGSASGNYLLSQPTNLAANITGKGVTISSGVTANNKVYDGTLAATLTTNNVVLSGVLVGETANVALTTNGYVANFASANVGTSIPVTVSGLGLTGSASGNYALLQPTNLTANIAGAAVTIASGLAANDKIYDRTTAATLTFNNVVLNGVAAADVTNVVLLTNGYQANFAGPNVGTGIAVTVNALALTGSASGNYVLSQPTNLTANITPKILTIVSAPPPRILSIGLTNGVATIAWTSVTNGIYRLQYCSSLSSNVWNDLAPDVTALSSIATRTDIVSNIALRFYRVKVPNPGFSANDKVYDGTTSATVSSNNVLLNGVVSGDIVGVSTNSYTASFVSPNVGIGIPVILTGLTLTGPAAGNYTLSQPLMLAANIMPAILTVNANNQSRTYGLPNPPLTVNYNGFVGSDGTNVVLGIPFVSTTATTNSLPGTYPIVVTAGSLSATNYVFTFVNGTLAVMSPPQLRGVLSSNQLVFSWPTIFNQTYQLQYKDNLTATNWIPLGNPMAGTGSTINVTNILGTSTQRFFRLVISF